MNQKFVLMGILLASVSAASGNVWANGEGGVVIASEPNRGSTSGIGINDSRLAGNDNGETPHATAGEIAKYLKNNFPGIDASEEEINILSSQMAENPNLKEAVISYLQNPREEKNYGTLSMINSGVAENLKARVGTQDAESCGHGGHSSEGSLFCTQGDIETSGRTGDDLKWMTTDLDDINVDDVEEPQTKVGESFYISMPEHFRTETITETEVFMPASHGHNDSIFVDGPESAPSFDADHNASIVVEGPDYAPSFDADHNGSIVVEGPNSAPSFDADHNAGIVVNGPDSAPSFESSHNGSIDAFGPESTPSFDADHNASIVVEGPNEAPSFDVP